MLKIRLPMFATKGYLSCRKGKGRPRGTGLDGSAPAIENEMVALSLVLAWPFKPFRGS